YGGDAIGGVILMEPARIPAKDTIYGKTLLSGATNGKGGNITTELTKAYENGWFVKGQASFKRYGDFEAPDYVLSNTGVSQLGASLGIGKHDFIWGWDAHYSYFDTNIAILRASDIGNIDDLIRAINVQQPLIVRDFDYDIDKPRQEVTHHLAKLKFYKRFEGIGKWNFQYDFQHNQRFEYDIRVGDDSEKASLDLRLATHTLSTDFKIDAKRNYTLNFGLMGLYQNNFANPDTGVRRLVPDYDKYDVGAFATGEYTVSNTLLLDAGLRYDFNYIDAKKFYRTSRWEERGYDVEFPDLVIENLGTQLLTNPKFEYHNFSATAGLQYDLDTETELRFNYALSQRAPNPSEIFSDGLHHSAARIELGDLRIKSETSQKLSLSIQKEGDTWGYTFAPYANFIKDFIVLEPTGVEFNIRGAFPVWTYRQTTARLLGLDANLFSQWTPHWRTDHNFSIVKGIDTDLGRPLINIPATHFRNSLSYTNSAWKDFKITLESQYVFRQNEFPPNITVFSPEQNQDITLNINTPPDAYHLIGLDSSFKIPLSEQNTLLVGLTVNNLLNTSYREYLNRLRYYADDLGRNFLIRLKLNY
ncbi:TonB-dependent receptor domain-containing protein, partial [Pricia sp.]|uniref:TonB-dependent receptor domain-containing protein n=1 Tax=Pricia sp. TaxID=2268138 RepID=UPI0035946438